MIKNAILVSALVSAMLISYLPYRTNAQAPSPTGRVLILYDSANAQYAKLGQIYAIMLRNLLGHFYLGADLVPVESYVAGQIDAHLATFYIGALYDDPLPASFLSDAAITQKTLVWFKYNLWQLAWDPAYSFAGTRGFSFLGLRGLNSAPSSTNPNPSFFDTILYKNRSLMKYYSYDPNTGVIKSDPDFGVTQITDATKAGAFVTAKNSATGEQAPYIVRSGNFWYFADLPLSYIGPRDRYLVLCDVLHDILNANHPEIHRAMVRLEDVSATVDPASMKKLVDYLKVKKITFSIATIPFYRDPLGWYNGGVAQEIHLKDAPDLLSSLQYASMRGGTVLMHGYTHQYDSRPNLYTAVSADDFEFWDATFNKPVAEDSESWAANRLSAGLNELRAQGYPTDVFEAPHYQASPNAYAAIHGTFNATYQRAVYYTSNNPTLDPSAINRDFAGGMFYPYLIASDYYGQRILPENLGNVEYNICNLDPTSCITYTWQDIVTNADYALVVRDGFGSFFFHPFWVEQDLAFLNAYSDFTKLVQGITSLGYNWIGMKDLSLTVTSISPSGGSVKGGTAVTIRGTDFEPGATVTIGGAAATNIVILNPTTITCLTPPGSRAAADVTVTNRDGRAATLSGGFAYR